MPRKKKEPTAPNVHTEAPFTPHVVKVLHLTTVKGAETYELRWTHPVTKTPDSHRLRCDKVEAILASKELSTRLRTGLAPQYGRAVRVAEKVAAQEAAATARPRAGLHTLPSVEVLWADQFDKKAQSLTSARYNLQRYVYPELEIYDVEGNATGEKLCLEKMPLADISERTIKVWKRSLAYVLSNRGKPYSSNTRALALRNLKALLEFAAKEGLIAKNPAKGETVDTRGTKKRDSFKDQAEFFSVIRHLPEWAKAPIMVLAYTGVRFGEGAGLKVGVLDLENCRINVVGQMLQDGTYDTTKTPSSEDWVPFHASLVPILEAHLDTLESRAPDDLLFRGQTARGKSLQNPSLNRALKAACVKARLDKTVTCHGLRRSLASWLHMNGVPIGTIKRILRHADVRTTMSYIDVDGQDMTRAMTGLAAVKL